MGFCQRNLLILFKNEIPDSEDRIQVILAKKQKFFQKRKVLFPKYGDSLDEVLRNQSKSSRNKSDDQFIQLEFVMRAAFKKDGGRNVQKSSSDQAI